MVGLITPGGIINWEPEMKMGTLKVWIGSDV